MPIELLYERICPSCGGWGEASSIVKFGMCKKCAVTNGKAELNALSFFKEIEIGMKDFANFFEKVTNGFKLWGSQKSWTMRLLKKENTSIIAPTGVGKTTLLMAYALYSALVFKEKVLILTPTSSLAKQVYIRIKKMNEHIGSKCKIVFYDSRLSKRKREELISIIKNEDYDILIITNSFLARNSHLFKEKYFGLIIADDVDSILNRSKNILLILNMLGYPSESIDLTKKIINLRSKMLVVKINNQDDIYHKLLNEYLELESRLYKILKGKKKGQLVIASATGRARSTLVSVMRELLSLDITGITLYARDVTDTFRLVNNPNEVTSTLTEIVSKLGSGGIILISPYNPIKSSVKISDIIKSINALGFKVAKASPSSIQKFLKGDLDLIIGSSSYYGVSIRGIDSPEKIRYVIFIGTPLFSTDLETILCSPRTLYRLLIHLKELRYNVTEHLMKLSRILRYSSSNELRLIKELLRGKIDLDSISNDKVKEKYETIQEIVKDTLNKYKSILDNKKIVKVGTIILCKEGNRYLALIPDIMTYIQASGRTSRLYNGVMTHGLSIIIEEARLAELIRALETKLRYYNNNYKIYNYKDIDIVKELNKIERSRQKTKNYSNKFHDTLKYKSILLIVESPTKAKTIAKFYGKPSRRKIGSINVYEVPLVKDNTIVHLSIVATKGHIYDLSTDIGNLHGIELSNSRRVSDIRLYYKTIKRCRVCGQQFTDGDQCPRCNSKHYTDAIEVVNVLRKLGSEVDEVIIATDPDMEGEKIAYDVYLIVKPINNNVYRIELHEITSKELKKALSNKRKIDEDLVNAQIFRRALDRLIGFKLSQQLWLVFNKTWLGAGRVQTPVLGWIIDNYYNYLKNKCYTVMLTLGIEQPYLRLGFCLEDRDKAKEITELLKSKNYVTMFINRTFVDEVNPLPPYTTDELLFDASRMGIPATIAMKVAQELFECGLITYHRTDFTYVSTQGIEIAKQYLTSKNMQEYFIARHWGGQGAHEAIRPTNPWDPQDLEKLYGEGVLQLPIYLSPIHLKIYDLIFRRFIASQMKPYKRLMVNVDIELPGLKINANIPIKIVNEGFNVIVKPTIYKWINIAKSSTIYLPVHSIKMFKSSKTRLLTQGQVVRLMKEKGIGRPSTYTTTLNNLKRHGYVVYSKRRGFVIPTKTGITVYEYLKQHYNELISESTTRWMELMIDKIKTKKLAVDSALKDVVSVLQQYNLLTTINGEKAVTYS